MRRRRFDWLRPTACGLLLLAAFCLPFVEVGDLLEDVWDDTPGSADGADGVRLVRRPLTAPDAPDSSAAPDVFGLAQSLPRLEPVFGLATGLVLPSVFRPARPTLCPRDIERGPPAPA